jgi:hypothetical protein
LPISGGLFFGAQIARDMEIERAPGFENSPNGGYDLVVLDGFGGAHFVQYPIVIPQDFFFPPEPMFPEGRAIDLEMSPDGLGFWVLTDFGGIFRAGSTKDPMEPPELPLHELPTVLGFDIPFPAEDRDPRFPNPGGATLRAVGFCTVQGGGEGLVEGFIVLDSRGGQYRLNPDGSLVSPGAYADTPAGDPRRLLDPSLYVTPFFPGLDIARDVEMHPTGQGLIVFDGWGGIHPVPVDDPDNPVYFATNLVNTVTVGMPYLPTGFDDIHTTIDEGDSGAYGPDAASIFVDLVFCDDGFGFYTLDKYGGIFAFGSTRPDLDQVTTGFQNSPYFYPELFAVDIETVPSVDLP